MMLKCMTILLALSAVVLAGKKDEYQRGSGCPCADFKSYEARDDENYSRGKRASSGEDCASRMRERKAFVKRQEKLRPRFTEGLDDVEGMPEEMYTGYNFYEGSDGFLSRRDGDSRKQMKDKKYRRDDYDADDDLDVSPQCQRYMNDVNRLVKCELKMSKMASESSRSFGDIPDVPAVCQKYLNADDPAKLARCVRKNAAVDVEPQTVYPECMDFVNDPYKMQKCERKARKYASANSMGKMLF